MICVATIIINGLMINGMRRIARDVAASRDLANESRSCLGLNDVYYFDSDK